MTHRLLRKCWTSASLIFLLGSFPALLAEEDGRPAPEDWSVDPISWQGEIDPGTVVRLSNAFGDLRVRGVENAGDTRVQIVGFVQHHKDDMRPARVEPRVSEARLELVVEMAESLLSGGGDESDESKATLSEEGLDPTWASRRVDLTIYVPKSAPLVVTTTTGDLWAFDSQARIDATTDGGSMRIETTGDFSVRSKTGPISLSVEEEDWSGEGRIETREGDIQVLLLRNAAIELVADLLGRVTTDFTTEVRATGGGRRQARVRQGEGGGKIEIESYQGQLSIDELPRATEQMMSPATEEP